MNFPFSVRRVLGGNNITRLDSRSLQTSTRGRFGKEVIKIINEMGQASASAQQLGSIKIKFFRSCCIHGIQLSICTWFYKSWI